MHLFIDDSGSRDPDQKTTEPRSDGMDYFALGGILINEEDIDSLIRSYKTFRARWEIDYPLHSWAIRGGREDFGWLKKPEAAKAFLNDLQGFILGLPITCIATVIDRPGYVARYKNQHADQLWLMCKTAYCILIERAAKHACRHDRKLRVFFEQSGKKEDRDIIVYAKALKAEGMPFDAGTSAGYGSLTAEEFRTIVLGEPRRKTKDAPMVQIADLVLYPIAKRGYDPAYAPYVALKVNNKLIDAYLAPEDRATLGIKYSCFDAHKTKARK